MFLECDWPSIQPGAYRFKKAFTIQCAIHSRRSVCARLRLRAWEEWDACILTDIWYSQWVWFLHPSSGGSVWLPPDSYHDSGHRSKTQTHSDPTSLHTNQKTHIRRAAFKGTVYPKMPFQPWLISVKHKREILCRISNVYYLIFKIILNSINKYLY